MKLLDPNALRISLPKPIIKKPKKQIIELKSVYDYKVVVADTSFLGEDW